MSVYGQRNAFPHSFFSFWNGFLPQVDESGSFVRGRVWPSTCISLLKDEVQEAAVKNRESLLSVWLRKAQLVLLVLVLGVPGAAAMPGPTWKAASAGLPQESGQPPRQEPVRQESARQAAHAVCGLQLHWSGRAARAEVFVCGQPILVLEQQPAACTTSDLWCNSLKNWELYADLSSAGNVLCLGRRTEKGRLSWNDSCKTCTSHSGNCVKRPA